ncbi:hypothetical protein GCM10010522_51360 [Kribbella solani]
MRLCTVRSESRIWDGMSPANPVIVLLGGEDRPTGGAVRYVSEHVLGVARPGRLGGGADVGFGQGAGREVSC